ncbi:MAG: squalene/phytoene synthase family protein [Phycisphaeraceae bacterium]|nr:squalene/phytoene synthase family protein [Phycisphaeraceae bacterium]
MAPIDLLPLIGPEAPAREAMSLAAALDYCRGLATSHYENFSVLTSLVPGHLRDDFAAVYAFCRWADDLGDETGADDAARARSLALLDWWKRETVSCFDLTGTQPPTAPTHPVFIALRETARKHAAHGLSAKPFLDLVDAFEQDQRVTVYETWDQCVDYCTRSANPVGRIVLMLGGYAPPEIDAANAERFAMSDATCTALQLINFWQDVRRDLLERDRVYLPSKETGISPEMLRAWVNAPEDAAARVKYIRAVRPLVERTSELFLAGHRLPRHLDPGLAPVVWLFGAGGEAIVRAVERMGCATLWHRPRLGKMTKAALVARAWVRSRVAGTRRA